MKERIIATGAGRPIRLAPRRDGSVGFAASQGGKWILLNRADLVELRAVIDEELGESHIQRFPKGQTRAVSPAKARMGFS